jgi:hypothetical protein
MWEYTIEFMAKRGCEQGIVDDMVRFDAGKIIKQESDADCAPGNIRRVTIEAKHRPTMQRWASFTVGARIAG